MTERDHTGRTVALVGGAGLVTWWLLARGKGWGLRSPGDGNNRGEGTEPAPAPARRVVWVRADRIEIDGVTADMPIVVAMCSAAGTAEVHATGDAITSKVTGLLKALKTAGVKLYVSPDLAYLVPSGPL